MTQDTLKVIQLVHHDFEDLELWYPVYRLREYGAVVHLVGETANVIYKGKYGVPVISDFGFADINADLYHAILVPGGWAPDKLRRFEVVLEMLRKMDAHKKPIGHICHAGWVLASAGILKGRKLTSTPGIKDDMVNAGAEWVDEEAVRDGNMVSARKPADLPAYMKQFIAVLDEIKHAGSSQMNKSRKLKLIKTDS